MQEFVVQPESMTVSLFPHQLSSIHMMEQRESTKRIDRHTFTIDTNVGIFADISGYGKTLSMIGLILRDKMAWNLDEDYVNRTISSVYGHGSIIKKTLIRFKRIRSNLVVTSTSILKQWGSEIETTPLKYIVLTNRKRVDAFDPCEYDIVLTSPSMYNYVLDRFPSYAWKRFIFDEPTQTKIPAMRQVMTGFSWFISATPNQLLFQQSRSNQNYLSSLFSNCMDYSLFRHIIIKNDDNFVRESFSLPAIHHVYHDCFQPVYQVVRNLISENITEMIAAGNIERAIRSLGGTSNDSIIELIECEKMDMIRETDIKLQRAERMLDEKRIVKWKTRREELLEQVTELRNRFDDMIVRDNCHICLEMKEKPVMLTCCQNVFCGSCVLKWLTNSSSCPMCRRIITTNMIHYISPPNVQSSSSSSSSKSCCSARKQTKPEKIIDIIHGTRDGKFIIFSSYDDTMNMIRASLQEGGIHFTEIAGTMNTRHRRIEDFKYGHSNVLFMNSMSNGAGINLQEATDIILYHKMPEDLETQIIGRAYRIGRKLPLNVHHLI